MCGHTHLALVLSGETATFLSLGCSDPVSEITESPMLNPLEAIYILVLRAAQLWKSYDLAVYLWDVNED